MVRLLRICPNVSAAVLTAALTLCATISFALGGVARAENKCADGKDPVFGVCGGAVVGIPTPQTQVIGATKVTLTNVDVSGGRVTMYLTFLNEGSEDVKRFMLFGKGAVYGGGGSFIVVDGRQILASTAEVGGRSSNTFTDGTLIAGVEMKGRVDFNGVDVSRGDIQVFSLAWSVWNTRPQGRLQFKRQQQ